MWAVSSTDTRHSRLVTMTMTASSSEPPTRTERTSQARLQMTPDAMRAFGYRIVDQLVQHATELPGAPVLRLPDAAGAALPTSLPQTGVGLPAALDLLDRHVWQAMMHLDHPRFFGFVPGPSNFVSAMADALVAGLNPFAGTWLEASGCAQVELITIDWLRQICGLPDGAGGHFVTGGSAANLTGLAIARRIRLDDDMTDAVVYCSDQTHASVQRALRLLGFPRHQLRTLESDAGFQLSLAELARAVAADRQAGLRPFCVVANAGTTNTGAVDPLPALADLCEREGLWLHIDGAYGAAAVLTDEGKRLLRGLERADSLALDPHKWLFQPYECGTILVRDARWLRQTFAMHAEYLEDTGQPGGETNFFEEGLQLTRAFRALKLWLSLQVFGIAAFRAAIAHGMGLAALAEAALRATPPWEVVAPGALGIIAFRYAPQELGAAATDALNQALVHAMVEEGFAFVSSTALRGRTVLRMCTINPRTTDDDIRGTVRRLGAHARRLQRSL